jgi:hypothetical protein
MPTLPQTTYQRKRPTNVSDWQNAEADQALREDHQHSAEAASLKIVAFYAIFDGHPGQAIRDSKGACWFYPETGSRMLLHETDRPALQLLGQVSIADTQHVLDTRAGDLARICTRRSN